MSLNKKILVTGGAGYLGSVLVAKLLQKGHIVTVIDILMFGGEGLIPHLSNPRFSLIRGDIRDSKLLIKVFTENSFDAVFHVAALVGDPACKINPKLSHEINYLSTISLATLAKKQKNTHFIFTSTCSNYGISNPDIIATESSELKPLSLYAETKIASEKELLKLHTASFCVTIVRLATIFGLSPKMRFNLLINEIVRQALFGKTILLYKENAWRPYTHTEDAVDALITILESKQEKVAGEIFNIGTENCRKIDIVIKLKKYLKNVNVEKKGGIPDLRDYRVSFEKIKQKLGFVPKKSISEGIEEMIAALKNGVFSNPHDEKYDMWLNQKLFK